MNTKKIIEKNKNSILLIDLQKPLEGNQKKISIRGTGFIISKDGKFITNGHVYKQIPENELQYIGVSVPGKVDEKQIIHYDRYSIKLLKIDEENDLALMQIVSDKEFDATGEIGDSDSVKEGEEVIYMGHPLATELLSMQLGITMTTNKCIISSIKRRPDGSILFFFVDTHTNNGSSGSPVFSIDTGKIIGVVSGKISSRIPAPDGKVIDIPANIGLCRPIKYATELINN